MDRLFAGEPTKVAKGRTLAHRALDVAHDQPVLVVQELHADLRHLLMTQARNGRSQKSVSDLIGRTPDV